MNCCLMPGLNDTREDAARIAAFCAPIVRTLVNVIPYNPGNHPLTRAPPTDEEVDHLPPVAARRRPRGSQAHQGPQRDGGVQPAPETPRLRERRRALRVVSD
ncbi:MAG: hypothetical protein R3B99_21625 [Polyangiales bacterium]